MKGSFVPVVGTQDPFARSVAQRLREVFVSTDYTDAGLEDLLGPGVIGSLEHGDELSARRAVAEMFGATADLVRLFALGHDLDPGRTLLAAGLEVADLVAVGVLAPGGSPGTVAATVRLLPHAVGEHESWLLADWPRRPLPDDHVLGLGGAARSLIGLHAPGQAETVLDLGTGSGAQLLHLAAEGRLLVGTDLNERALTLASWSLSLSQVRADLLAGDRYVPVQGRRFGLIVSNPPFVIEPQGGSMYRSSGAAHEPEGDAMTASIVTHALDHLVEGGRAQIIGNWLHIRGRDWRERVAGWVPPGLDAWVVQRDAVSPEQYVRTWLDDEGLVDPVDRAGRYDAWMEWFDDHEVEAIGLGWVNLQEAGGSYGVRRLEALAQPVEQPIGPVVDRALTTWRLLDDMSDAALWASAPRLAQGVLLEQCATHDDHGWSPERPVLVQTLGVRRRAPIDGLGVAVTGALDGRRTLQEAVRAAAQAADLPAEEVLDAALEALRGLIQAGFVDLEHPSSIQVLVDSV